MKYPCKVEFAPTKVDKNFPASIMVRAAWIFTTSPSTFFLASIRPADHHY
jgi:hypothetical protein